MSACFHITADSRTPLIRASLTYSLSSTSSMLDRVRRMKAADTNHPSVSAGNTMLSASSRPLMGNHPRSTAKNRIISSPTRNDGNDPPAMENARAR